MHVHKKLNCFYGRDVQNLSVVNYVMLSNNRFPHKKMCKVIVKLSRKCVPMSYVKSGYELGFLLSVE